MRRWVVAVLGLALAASMAACGGDGEKGDEENEGEGNLPACGQAPPELSGGPDLPPEFPTPDGVTYTGQSEAGPSSIVEGYFDGELPEAFDAYKAGFGEAGYDVTFSEQEADDAEVNFAGGDTNGQVRLGEECQGRTEITITIRPD